MSIPNIFRARYTPFIGGKFVQSAAESIAIRSPASGDFLTTVDSTSPEQATDAITRANAVFEDGIWSQASVQHRASVLSRLAIKLQERVPDFAAMESLQTGRTIREMKTQLGRLPEWLHYYAALLRTKPQGTIAPTQGQVVCYTTQVPLGVCVQITPFNHPLLIAVKKIGPALAAGNSVLVKPSELAPVTVLELAEMAVDAGLPPDVLQVVPGEGRGLVPHLIDNTYVKKVDITAGTATGRAIGEVVGRNLAHYTAELGGKAPALVFADADLETAVNGVTFASFIASGQTCVSGTRIIVHESIFEGFLSSFMNKVASITRRIGHPMNPQSAMGPVISWRQLERLEHMLASTNGHIICGGQRMTGKSVLDGHDLSSGSYLAPTVVRDVQTDDILWQEECFGPVVVVVPFKDETDGIRLANASKYGLGSSIWTQDLGTAHRVAGKLEHGLVWVNTAHRNDPSSPWGGMKESGIGRENGVEALESYSQSKTILMNIATPEYSKASEDWFSESSSNVRYG
ncbi:aldehyde dehydrogenase [Auriculariales sp. MPI-PUGE-AT-0066]|nr:aldehyde dehydrogenase [Auriculariales sp. MPI-PUGE-AT-0066]